MIRKGVQRRRGRRGGQEAEGRGRVGAKNTPNSLDLEKPTLERVLPRPPHSGVCKPSLGVEFSGGGL